MDLNEQAQQAVAALLVTTGSALDSYELQLAQLAWLDGYKAGMDATQTLAEDAITKALS